VIHAATPPLASQTPFETIHQHSRELIAEIQKDKFLCRSYKNMLINQEKIIMEISTILSSQNECIQEADIRKGVDISLTRIQELSDSTYRNKRLKVICEDLHRAKMQSRFFDPILADIKRLIE